MIFFCVLIFLAKKKKLKKYSLGSFFSKLCKCYALLIQGNGDYIWEQEATQPNEVSYYDCFLQLRMVPKRIRQLSMEQKMSETIASDHLWNITLLQMVSPHKKSAVWNHIAFYKIHDVRPSSRKIFFVRCCTLLLAFCYILHLKVLTSSCSPFDQIYIFLLFFFIPLFKWSVLCVILVVQYVLLLCFLILCCIHSSNCGCSLKLKMKHTRKMWTETQIYSFLGGPCIVAWRQDHNWPLFSCLLWSHCPIREWATLLSEGGSLEVTVSARHRCKRP